MSFRVRFRLSLEFRSVDSESITGVNFRQATGHDPTIFRPKLHNCHIYRPIFNETENRAVFMKIFMEVMNLFRKQVGYIYVCSQNRRCTTQSKAIAWCCNSTVACRHVAYCQCKAPTSKWGIILHALHKFYNSCMIMYGQIIGSMYVQSSAASQKNGRDADRVSLQLYGFEKHIAQNARLCGLSVLRRPKC